MNKFFLRSNFLVSQYKKPAAEKKLDPNVGRFNSN